MTLRPGFAGPPPPFTGSIIFDKPKHRPRDDFLSVARRLEADEDKARFEAKLRNIAKVKPPAEN